MKHLTAMTKNVRRFLACVDELMHRPYGTEGMGLLWGTAGQGKTTTIAYVNNAMDGVYVRVLGSMTVTSLLGTISKELGGQRMLRRSDMIDFIVEQLGNKPRPIFVDEADYLFKKASETEMLDSLRDIYDLSGCPVILVGMEEIARKLQSHGRFARRVTQWVEFEGIDLDDTRTVAKTIIDIEVADDLLEYIHRECSANIGRIVIAFSRVEKMGKANGIDNINLEQWGERPLYYDQPTFSAKKKS